MADDHQTERKQTTPKGAEIPVPTRDAVLRDLMKVAPPPDAKQPKDGKRPASTG